MMDRKLNLYETAAIGKEKNPELEMVFVCDVYVNGNTRKKEVSLVGKNVGDALEQAAKWLNATDEERAQALAGLKEKTAS